MNIYVRATLSPRCLHLYDGSCDSSVRCRYWKASIMRLLIRPGAATSTANAQLCILYGTSARALSCICYIYTYFLYTYYICFIYILFIDTYVYIDTYKSYIFNTCCSQCCCCRIERLNVLPLKVCCSAQLDLTGFGLCRTSKSCRNWCSGCNHSPPHTLLYTYIHCYKYVNIFYLYIYMCVCVLSQLSCHYPRSTLQFSVEYLSARIYTPTYAYKRFQCRLPFEWSHLCCGSCSFHVFMLLL